MPRLFPPPPSTAEQRGWITSKLLALCAWVQSTGTFGVVVYTLFLACAVVVGAPCTVLEILPGLLFGWPVGFAVAMVGKFTGSTISVMLAKTLLKDYVLNTIIPKYKVLQIMAAVVQRNGFVAVLLFRGVVMAPLAVKNYGLGAIGVSTPSLLAAAFITNLPYSLWWSYCGSTAKDVVDILDGKDVEGPTKHLMENPEAAAAAAVVAAVVVLAVAKKGKQEWDRAAQDLQKKREDGAGAGAGAGAGSDNAKAGRTRTEPVLDSAPPPTEADNLALFGKGKRRRKAPARFVAKN